MSRVQSPPFAFPIALLAHGAAQGRHRSPIGAGSLPGTPYRSGLLRSFPDRFVNRFGTDRLLRFSACCRPTRSGTAIKAKRCPIEISQIPAGRCAGYRPRSVVIAFALVMTACVLGVVVWKALEAKKTALARGQTDIQNLAHSLAEHAAHTIQSADIAMAGMVDLLKYRDPLPERFNRYLAETVNSLPQLREIGVLDADGKWLYSSLPETPRHNNSDRRYFTYHRDTPGSALRINEPLQSRLTGRSTIILSKRIDRQDGSFAGVLTAAIDSDYFNRFYRTFQLGPDGSISLLRNDGVVLIRWPLSDRSTDLSGTDLFSRHLKLSSVGYYKIISPFDGIAKYFGYEETPHYPTVVTVAMSEDWLLSDWRKTLRTDAIVAGVLLCMILLLAALLFSQFRFRMKTERTLREREAHYRLLANNIADIIILIDARSLLRYVSQSVEPVLGLRPKDLLGKSCFDLIHPEDRESVRSATARLSGIDSVSTVVFRTIAATERWRGSKASSSWRRSRATPRRRNSSASSAMSPNASGWRMS